MRLWIVEDDPDFVTALLWRLRKIVGVDADVIGSPSEAMGRLAGGERPDAVVSDYVFAGVATGADVVRSARSREIPAVLCSDLDPRWSPPDVRITRKIDLLSHVKESIPGLAQA